MGMTQPLSIHQLHTDGVLALFYVLRFTFHAFLPVQQIAYVGFFPAENG
jgi:hypothetical protein